MKFLYVIGSVELGGAEQHLLRVTTALRTRGFEPVVFVMTLGGTLAHDFERGGVPLHGVELPTWVERLVRHPRILAWLRLFCSAAALWWWLWRLRPAAVHFFLPAAYIVGGVVSVFGPPTRRIMSRRSLNLYQQKHRLFRRLEHWLHPRMDTICGNSQAVVNDLQTEGVRPEQLKLIYNGIDLGRFDSVKPRAEVREALGVPPDALVFVMLANLIPYKGHADLLQAFARIQGRLGRSWVCWCVGRDDGIGSSLKGQAQALGIEQHVAFLGARTDVPDLLCAADVGVLCSHEEGFSNAVLEGMAAALPMVVTDVGGNAEAVLDGQTGHVVPARSPDALAEALWRVASDDQRVAMGQRSLARVREAFSWNACVDAYVDLYRRSGTSV